MADVLDRLGNPDAITIEDLVNAADESNTTASRSFAEWLSDRKSHRAIPHRLEACGYLQVRNPDTDSGLWRIPTGTNGETKRQAVYVKQGKPERERYAAARQRAGQTGQLRLKPTPDADADGQWH